MNDEGFTDPRDLLASLHVVNAQNERAEDSEVLVKFADEAMRELPDLDAYTFLITHVPQPPP